MEGVFDEEEEEKKTHTKAGQSRSTVISVRRPDNNILLSRVYYSWAVYLAKVEAILAFSENYLTVKFTQCSKYKSCFYVFVKKII